MDYQRYVEIKLDNGSSTLGRKKQNGDYEIVDRNIILLSLSLKISAMVGLVPKVITKNSIAFKPYKDETKVVLLDISRPEKCTEFFGLVLEASKSRINNLVYKNLSNLFDEPAESISYSGIVNYYEWIVKQMKIYTVECGKLVDDNVDKVLKMLKVGIFVSLNKIDLRKPYFMVEPEEKKAYTQFYRMLGVEQKEYRSTDSKVKAIPKIDDGLLLCIEDILESVMKNEKLEFSSTDLNDDSELSKKSLNLKVKSKSSDTENELRDDKEMDSISSEVSEEDVTEDVISEALVEPKIEAKKYVELDPLISTNLHSTLLMMSICGMTPSVIDNNHIEITPEKCLSIPNDVVANMPDAVVSLNKAYPTSDIAFFKLLATSSEDLMNVDIKSLFKTTFETDSDFDGKPTYYAWLNDKVQECAKEMCLQDEQMQSELLDNIDEVSKNMEIACFIAEHNIVVSKSIATLDPTERVIYNMLYQKLGKNADEYEKAYMTSFGFKNSMDTLPKIDPELCGEIMKCVIETKNLFVSYSKLSK